MNPFGMNGQQGDNGNKTFSNTASRTPASATPHTARPNQPPATVGSQNAFQMVAVDTNSQRNRFLDEPSQSALPVDESRNVDEEEENDQFEAASERIKHMLDGMESHVRSACSEVPESSRGAAEAAGFSQSDLPWLRFNRDASEEPNSAGESNKDAQSAQHGSF